MSEGITFSGFWKQRNPKHKILLDRLTANNISVFIAFAAYKLGITPNQLSLLAGITSTFPFVAALVLPPDWMPLSVVTIYVLAQVSYLFDCADGQLARATGSTSKFGAFLDLAIDVASAFLCLGAFFLYAYRYFDHLDFINKADLFLLVGFLFIGARTSRFVVWQLFSQYFPDTYHSTKTKETTTSLILKSSMEYQCSLFNMLMFLLSPMVCLAIFVAQAVILGTVYVSYFFRAWPR